MGDFTSSGKIDLLVSDYGYSSQFSIMQGNGDGTFQPEQVVTLPTQNVTAEISMAVGDFNNDGLLDFVLDDYYAYIYVQQ